MVAIIHQHNDMGFLPLLTDTYINSSGAPKTERTSATESHLQNHHNENLPLQSLTGNGSNDTPICVHNNRLKTYATSESSEFHTTTYMAHKCGTGWDTDDITNIVQYSLYVQMKVVLETIIKYI